MIFEPKQLFLSQCMVELFKHKVDGVVNVIFGDHLNIVMHQDSILQSDGESIIHFYWDGNGDSDIDHKQLSIPFDWINKSYEELIEIKKAYWGQKEGEDDGH